MSLKDLITFSVFSFLFQSQTHLFQKIVFYDLEITRYFTKQPMFFLKVISAIEVAIPPSDISWHERIRPPSAQSVIANIWLRTSTKSGFGTFAPSSPKSW